MAPTLFQMTSDNISSKPKTDLKCGKKDTANASKTDIMSVAQGRKMRKQRGRRGLDKCFGKFRCTFCGRYWESAHVWTRTGTKKVTNCVCEGHFPFTNMCFCVFLFDFKM